MIRLIIICWFTIGLGLFLYSRSLPYFKDQKAKNELTQQAYSLTAAEYYEQDAALRTQKCLFMDLGSGIVVAAVWLLLFALTLEIRTPNDLRNMYSINNKANVFVLGNIAWLILAPGLIWDFVYRMARDSYPPNGDSIGIGAVAGVFMVVALLIPLNIVLYISTRKSIIPTALFDSAEYMDTQLWLWEIFFSLLLMCCVFVLTLAIKEGIHVVIVSCLFYVYLLLSLRAGKIAFHNRVLKWPGYGH